MEVKSFVIFAVLFIIKNLFHPASSSNESPTEGIVVSGIYAEKMEDVPMNIYENLIPIVFEFKLNQEIIPTTLTIQEPRMIPKYACRNDARFLPSSGFNWQYTCPIFYHMNQLITSFKANFTDNFFNSNFNNRARFLSETVAFANRFLQFEECESQLRTFAWKGINTRRDTGLSEYRAVIEKCATASYFEENIGDYSWNATYGNLPYEKMRDTFLMSFSSNWNTTGEHPNFGASLEASTVAIFLGLQNMLTLNSYVEITRWREAMLSCQSNVLPSSLVKIPRLERALGIISDQLGSRRSNKLEIGLSINQLYQLPLTDCIFGTKSLFVRLLIPARRSDKIYKGLRIVQPPFLYDTEICRIGSKESSSILSLSNLNLIYETTSKDIIETKCNFENGEFCKISSNSHSNNGLLDKCLSTIGPNSIYMDKNVINGLRKHCEIQCELVNTSSKVTFPIVEQIGSNKYLVTTNTITPLLIKCEIYGHKDKVIHPQKYGGTEVTLPCGCYMVLHTQKYYPSKPCSTFSNIPVIQHAIPAHMINTTFYIPYVITGFQTAGLSSYFSRHYLLLNLPTRVNMTFREQELNELDLGLRGEISSTNRSIVLEDQDEEKSEFSGTVNSTFNDSFINVVEDANDESDCCAQRQLRSTMVTLWILLVGQFMVLLVICGIIYYKITKKIHGLKNNRNELVSFSVSNATSQVTLAEK